MGDEKLMNKILLLSINDNDNDGISSRNDYYIKNLNVSPDKFKILYKKMIKINEDYVDITEFIQGVLIQPNYKTRTFLDDGGYVRLKRSNFLKNNSSLLVSIIAIIISIIALFN